MSDYKNFPYRFVDIGLHLLESVDKVPEGAWVRLHNIKAAREAQIAKREGLSLDTDVLSGLPIHTLTRLDGNTKLIGSGTSLYRNNTAYPTGGYSGDPLNVVVYRPSIAANVWAYIADGNQMRKVRADGTDYKWGVTAPVDTPVGTAGAAGLLNSSVAGGSVYTWQYTYYSSVTGAESNPSPESAGIACVNQQAAVSVTASADPQVDTIRVYRSGGTESLYHLVGTTSNITGSFSDNNADVTAADGETLDIDHDVPFTSVDSNGNELTEVPLPYVWGPFLGKYVFASGDPNRPGYLYWTNAQDPDSASSFNNVEVTSPREPLLGGFIYGPLPFVWSRDNLYRVDFGKASTASFIANLTQCGRGLSAPWAFCVSDAIYFLGRDNIYRTDGQSAAEPISEDIRPIFQGTGVGGFSPVDYTQTTRLRMSYTYRSVHFFYLDTLGNSQHLIYDTQYQRWRSASSDLTTFHLAYGDENIADARLFYGGSDGRVYEEDIDQATDSGTPINVEVMTGSADFGAPSTLKELGNVLIDADPRGETITVTPYYDAETIIGTPLTISGNGRQKFPLSLADTYCYSAAFKLSWTGAPVIYQMEVLWRLDEEEITHWEFPETAHTLSGWQHVRDAYISLNSSAVVTFTHTIDGVPHTYDIPSTNGEERKVPIQLGPYKGKLFRYAFDSAAKFRIYGEDCEFRIKPWNTALGYKLMTPFLPVEGGT